MPIDLQKMEQKFNALFEDENFVTDFEQWLEARNVSQNGSNSFVSGRAFWETLFNSESDLSHWEIIHDSKNKTVRLLYVPHENYSKDDIDIKMSYVEFEDLLQFAVRLSEYCILRQNLMQPIKELKMSLKQNFNNVPSRSNCSNAFVVCRAGKRNTYMILDLIDLGWKYIKKEDIEKGINFDTFIKGEYTLFYNKATNKIRLIKSWSMIDEIKKEQLYLGKCSNITQLIDIFNNVM